MTKPRKRQFDNIELERLYNQILEDYRYFNQHEPFTSGLGISSLEDTDRSITLMNKIYGQTQKGDVVIDLGAGTGVLGLTALLKGADKVYFIDINPQLTNFISFLATSRGYEDDKYQVIAADVTKPEQYVDKIELPEGRKINQILCELINSGLMLEPQVAAVKNIRDSKLCSDNVTCTPSCATNYIHLSDENNNPLTEKVKYSEVDFLSSASDGVNGALQLKITRDGVAHNAVITTDLYYPDGDVTGAFEKLCKPRKLNLTNDIGNKTFSVKKNQNVELALQYEYGCKKLPDVKVISVL